MGLSAKTLMKRFVRRICGIIFRAKWLNSTEGLLKNYVSELARQIPRIPPKWCQRARPQNLPSTRAGGQDDVSLSKLPQIKMHRAAPTGRKTRFFRIGY